VEGVAARRVLFEVFHRLIGDLDTFEVAAGVEFGMDGEPGTGGGRGDGVDDDLVAFPGGRPRQFIEMCENSRCPIWAEMLTAHFAFQGAHYRQRCLSGRGSIRSNSCGTAATVIATVFSTRPTAATPAAWSFHDEADLAAEPWVHDKAVGVLDGNAHTVAAGIRRLATRRKLDPRERTGTDTRADYLAAKAPYLDYPTALQAGWPTATGVIEGS
jgi:hypothetical protein